MTLDWIGLAFVYAAFGKRKKLGEGEEERGERGTLFKTNGVLRLKSEHPKWTNII